MKLIIGNKIFLLVIYEAELALKACVIVPFEEIKAQFVLATNSIQNLLSTLLVGKVPVW